MYDGKSHIRVEGEEVIRETPVFNEYGDYAAHKREVVLTKDVFVECFNKWIGEDKTIKLKLTFAEPDSLTQDGESEDDLCQ